MILDFLVESCKEGMIKEGKAHYFTGEKDLVLTSEELNSRLMKLNPPLAETLKVEANVFTSNDLIKFENDMVHIPDWDLFITQLDSFYTVALLVEDDIEDDFIDDEG